MRNALMPSIILASAFLGGVGACNAADSLFASKTELHGYASLEIGQYMDFWLSAMQQSTELTHLWVNAARVNLTASSTIGDHFAGVAGIEEKMWYNTYPQRLIHGATHLNIPTKFFTLYLSQAEGLFTYGTGDRTQFQAEFGYFPYKYNPDVRNLGEYLFRTGVFPAYIVGEFDYPQARLFGLRAGLTLHSFFHQDLLLTSETDFKPYGDFTLSWLFDVDLRNIISLGGGVSLSHLLSVDKSLTSPKNANYNLYFTDSGDSAYYTFRGTKIMARAALDPKRIFDPDGTNRMLGKQDLRLWGEAAILGAENYPANALTNPYGYDTLSHKLPIAFGFNLPAFNFLDVISLEAQWYGCAYPNNYQRVAEYSMPIPDLPLSARSSSDYRKDDWKWSVYVKKTFAQRLSIIAQAARDHLRTAAAYPEDMDREEMMSTEKQWYWVVKTLFAF